MAIFQSDFRFLYPTMSCLPSLPFPPLLVANVSFVLILHKKSKSESKSNHHPPWRCDNKMSAAAVPIIGHDRKMYPRMHELKRFNCTGCMDSACHEYHAVLWKFDYLLNECKRLNSYSLCYGRQFQLHTHHQPLLQVLQALYIMAKISSAIDPVRALHFHCLVQIQVYPIVTKAWHKGASVHQLLPYLFSLITDRMWFKAR